MFEKETTEILQKFLTKKCREAEKEIEEKGVLSDDNAIPLLLKTYFNHITHLDMELTGLRKLMDQRFEQVDKRFEQVDQRFEGINEKIDGIKSDIFTRVNIGFTIIAFLIILFGFLK